MKKIFSKILAGSLLTSTVVYCFGSCVSAMDQVDENNFESLLKFFANENSKNKSEIKLLGNKRESDKKIVPGKVFEKEKNKKLDISDNFDFNVSLFDKEISAQLISSFFVQDNNIYFKRVSTSKEYKKIIGSEWSKACRDLSMLRIVRLILMLEYLRDTGKLQNYECVDDFLDVVQRIKEDALKNHDGLGDKQIGEEDLLYFIDYFLPVIDRIRCNSQCVLKKLEEIKRSLRLSFGKSHIVNGNGCAKLNKLLYKDKEIFKMVFQTLKTLDYFEKEQKKLGKLIQPEFLLKDHEEYRAKVNVNTVLDFKSYNIASKHRKFIK